MTHEEKERLTHETRLKKWRSRLKEGYRSIHDHPIKGLCIVAYIVVCAVVWIFRSYLFDFAAHPYLASFYDVIWSVSLVLLSMVGLFVALLLMGTPKDAYPIDRAIQRTKIKNHAGESPYLVRSYPDHKQHGVTVLEFHAVGTPRTLWEDAQPELEAALNINVAKISEGADKHHILVYTVPGSVVLPKSIAWEDKYLSKEEFVLRFGESLCGPVTVNLAQIPHILLGGSTGSGKSILLKLLLMQCAQKGAVVYIADFKGGVDFPQIWHRKCKLIYDKERLLSVLTSIVNELQTRKVVFREDDFANITQYNRVMHQNLPRIIVACDEVAELLDKTGLSKEEKDLVYKIENKLSIIARQGRAFGIHLILATQRPDATILAGQIRNNIDCRACGRADNVLSQIILDNTSAADQIPKGAQGRFIMQNGTVFQAYWFDETNW